MNDKESYNKLKYSVYAGIMISLGIAITVSSIIKYLVLDKSSFYLFGIFAGGLFIGIGLLPFKMERRNETGKKKD